ncbi:MAG: hypothetical protein WCC44_14365 [Azonexus sp.]
MIFQVRTQILQVEATVNRPQQVIGRNMILKIEAVEQSILITLLLPHHLGYPLASMRMAYCTTGVFQQHRPVADIRSLHKAAIRMSDVLRNLPEGQFTQLCQNGRLACWQLPTSMHPWIQPVHGAGQSNASRPARSILDVD